MKDALGLLDNTAPEDITLDNFLLREGDGLKLYDRVYKVTAIKQGGDKIILKRVE